MQEAVQSWARVAGMKRKTSRAVMRADVGIHFTKAKVEGHKTKKSQLKVMSFLRVNRL
jgi:hypothetical protein